MVTLLLIACLSVALMGLAVRRALPIAIACLFFWATQQAGYDLLTACLAAAAMFAVSSMLFDRAAMSVHSIMRFSVRAVECAAGAIVAVFLASTVASGIDNATTMTSAAVLTISAALLGGLITALRYRTT